jgi:hypothetical protein
MPVDRNGRVPNTNGQMVIHEPGAYRHALERKCDHDAMAAAADYLLPETDAELAAWHEANAERKRALMAERHGKPIRVQAYMLPQGLHAPFDRWPRGGQRGLFVVTPDDEIRLVPRESTIHRAGGCLRPR